MALPADTPDPPDMAVIMLNTKLLNGWLGTSYTMEEVAEMNWLTFEILSVLQKALNPPKGTK